MNLQDALAEHGHRQVNIIVQTDNPVSRVLFDTLYPGESTPESWAKILTQLDRTKTKFAQFMEDQK